MDDSIQQHLSRFAAWFQAISAVAHFLRAQSREVWERTPGDKEKFWKKYARDLVSLLGLMLALVITLSLTSIGGAAQAAIVNLASNAAKTSRKR